MRRMYTRWLQGVVDERLQGSCVQMRMVSAAGVELDVVLCCCCCCRSTLPMLEVLLLRRTISIWAKTCSAGEREWGCGLHSVASAAFIG